ncbi:hypothetical protein [Cupriavidus sp. TA19]|uniref:hypothetical protein n=1 Tax=Cupriavidus sp. TA19 TaxID=701108 RepID=UPI00295EB43F|nr:hypothetical protein [Cupriavidus sp. TA19]
MHDATRRPLLAHSPSSQGIRSFAKIDAIDFGKRRPFCARPIKNLAPTFDAALPRFRLTVPYPCRDEIAVTILSNALRMAMVTRWQWSEASMTVKIVKRLSTCHTSQS